MIEAKSADLLSRLSPICFAQLISTARPLEGMACKARAMRILRILLAVYFLIALRGHGQALHDGVAAGQTYFQALLAVAIIGWCIAGPSLITHLSAKKFPK